jgi:hypothetical protein
MKREIVCTDCQKKLEKLFKNVTTEHPEEHVKFVKGTLRFICVCDNCGIALQPRQGCYALSIWSDYGTLFCPEWELEYIEPILASE